MNSAKIALRMFTVCATLFLPLSASAAGIDDLTNYQAPPPKVVVVQPYTIEDVIATLPKYLDDGERHAYKGYFYLSNAISDYDPKRGEAFDEKNFGKCEDFYIQRGGYSRGGSVFESTLEFLFPENEERKQGAALRLKDQLKAIEDPEVNLGAGCENRAQYVVKLKEMLNAVIQAVPSVLEEKRRLVEAPIKARAAEEKALAEERAAIEARDLMEQKERDERNRVEGLANEKARADRQAIEQAERKGREERENVLKACQSTERYKLYSFSEIIERNQSAVKNYELTIQRQKEAAKISGFVNKQVMYEMGNRIEVANRLNKQIFDMYKKSGGTAKSIGVVKSLPNPCSQ